MRHMLLIPVEGPTSLVEANDFTQMAELIGARYIERVKVDTEWALAVDEDGLLKDRPFNERASVLYGFRLHGQPVVGDVLLGPEGFVGDGVDWVDTTEQEVISFLVRGLETR